eukprot:c23246_g2_i4 orf=218-2680(-)
MSLMGIKDCKGVMDSGKYVRYSNEQVEALERLYNECPKPSALRRQQLIRECPILSNIEPKQIKVWFQNRRCREKQRKEAARLQTVNGKLTAMNKLLMEENDRLQKQVAQLLCENGYLRQQLPQGGLTTTDTSCDSVVTSGLQHLPTPQHPPHDAATHSGILSLAEEALAEFLQKATGTAIDWIQMPGMKPGPDSIGVAVSHGQSGIAARTCGLVRMEPIKVAEIVKNRSSWLRECRQLKILATFGSDHGGLVELVHTEMYSPTPLAPPRDFFTLRYTCCMEDGSLVICEKSLTAAQGEYTIPCAVGFVRAEMLPSGYVIRPCENGGSTVLIVYHVNFEARGIPDIFCPVYESSNILVPKIIFQHLCCIAREVAGENSIGNYQATSLWGFSHCLIRGFNDAVHCFSDDGWISFPGEGPSTISVCVKPLCNLSQIGQYKSFSNANLVAGGIICAKSSMLLQGVSPTLLIHFLREHQAAWLEFEIEAHDVAIPRISTFSKGKLSSTQVLLPTVGSDELLEVIRLESHKSKDGIVKQKESFSLQLCTGVDGNSIGSYAQLIFSPIDASIPADASLLPSGFRIVHLDDNVTPDLTSTLEERIDHCRLTCNTHSVPCQQQSVVTLAFQFLYEVNVRDVVAIKAQQYVHLLLNFIQRAAFMLCPCPLLDMDPTWETDMLVLVRQIAESYRFYFGKELLHTTDGCIDMVLKDFWSFRYAIVCCAWKPRPEFVFANCAALHMLEIKLPALKDMSLEITFRDGGRKIDYSQPPPFMHKEGHANLPAGVCITGKGRAVSFEFAIGWKVLGGDSAMQVAAFMFCNWSFMVSS